MRIAIQGERGSFSEEASLGMFPKAIIVACTTFAEVFSRLVTRQVDRAVIPIENTLAGSVGENYDLLRSSNVGIIGETKLRIEHNLILAPGARLKDIRRVLSHPVALQQCLTFLRSHRQWEAVPFYDTAGSVKHITANGLSDTLKAIGRCFTEHDVLWVLVGEDIADVMQSGGET